jgi:glycosyltransferase involved in cell wall biosynthesis
MDKIPFLSIVTPTFNEEQTIVECLRQVAEIMKAFDADLDYEHIIVDNASTDLTIELALAFAKNDSHVKVALNDRNIGGSLNIYRGLSLTRGEWVVPMLPADLQDPAEIIPSFIQEINPDSNVVFGIRKFRSESRFMRIMRNLYYRLIRKLAAVEIPLQSGDFCLIHRDMVDALIGIEDENPYLRGLIAQLAKSPRFVEYKWGKRLAGESKASLIVLVEVAISGLVSTTQVPARIALFAGFLISLSSVLWALIQVILVVGFGHNASPGIATIAVAIFFFGGIQLFFTGLIGEYVLSIHRQVKKAPKAKTKIIS